MRILLVSGSFPPMRCGVGDYTARLAAALAKLDDTHVAVLTDYRAGTGRMVGDVEVLPTANRWRMSDYPQILRTVRRWKPDVIHIQYPTQGYEGNRLPWLLPLLLWPLRISIVQTWHEHFQMSRRSRILAIIPGGLIVVRPDYKEAMSPFYRRLIKHKLFKFIPNASVVPRVDLTETERVAIRSRFIYPGKSLITYFGFIFPNKSVELLFDIADPQTDHLVLVGECNEEKDYYHRSILEKSRHSPWKGKVTVTGFLPAEEVAQILASSDAVVLPFRDGGGLWNTSLHAALVQGTFVLSTSRDEHGYDRSRNLYFARPGDVSEMREALRKYVGERMSNQSLRSDGGWEAIARAHVSVYLAVRH
jgi:glycosyltransferase involved in cell wall biosynthesis